MFMLLRRSTRLRAKGAWALLAGGFADPALAADLPADVAAFLEDRRQCDHFLGEEPSDAARGTRIKVALDGYCRDRDARIAKLKRKYRARLPTVLEVLAPLEDRIE